MYIGKKNCFTSVDFFQPPCYIIIMTDNFQIIILVVYTYITAVICFSYLENINVMSMYFYRQMNADNLIQEQQEGRLSILGSKNSQMQRKKTVYWSDQHCQGKIVLQMRNNCVFTLISSAIQIIRMTSILLLFLLFILWLL